MWNRPKLWIYIFSIIVTLICIIVVISIRTPLLTGLLARPTLPPRPFTTTSLLITPNLLPTGWKYEITPEKVSCHANDFYNCQGVSQVYIHRVETQSDYTNLGIGENNIYPAQSRIQQIVAYFKTVQDAAAAYRNHDRVRNTQGQFPSTWKLMANFTYTSSIAQEFRVMCETTSGIPDTFTSCALEAQYEEFLIILLYDTPDSEQALGDMETIAQAVDAQMKRHIVDASVSTTPQQVKFTPPPRSFITDNLLITPNMLSAEWKYGTPPRKFLCPPDHYSYCQELRYSALQRDGSSVNPAAASGMSQTVVRFQTMQEANAAYREHYDVQVVYVRDLQGKLALIWKPIVSFTYISPLAQEFRVLCEDNSNIDPTAKSGTRCVIEAQYDEFLSIVSYVTGDAEKALADIEAIAIAVDTQMSKYIK